MYKKDNCQPQKIPISSVLQMPFWIYLSSAIRNLTFGQNGILIFTYNQFFMIDNLQENSLQMEQISNEAFLWLSSLASSDPYAILSSVYLGIALINLTVNFFSKFMNINLFIY